MVRDDPTKTSDRRRVALDSDAVALLKPLRKKREQYAPWMVSETDEPPKPDRVGYWWRRGREIAGGDEAWRPCDAPAGLSMAGPLAMIVLSKQIAGRCLG